MFILIFCIHFFDKGLCNAAYRGELCHDRFKNGDFSCKKCETYKNNMHKDDELVHI